jgi:DICT domain-containing protein
MTISLFRSIATQYQHLRRVNTVSMMNVISHQIEDQIIQHQLAVDFFAGFQKFSNFPDQMRRYSRLGSLCRRVYVFGVADCQPPNVPGVEFVEIAPTSALAREWFLLVDTPDFWSTLVAQEIDGKDPLSGGRRYDGLWSFDEHVVDRISLLMSQIMETSYQPIERRNYSQQNMHIAEISSRMLGTLEQTDITGQRRWARLQTIHKLAEMTVKHPLNLLQNAAQVLQEIFGATGVVIALKGTGEHYTVPIVEGEANGKGWKVPLTEGISGRVIQQGRLIQLLDIRQRHDSDFLLPTAKAVISAPIVNRQIYGAVTVGNLRQGQWNDEDGQTLVAIARILAVQLEQTLNLTPGSVMALGPTKRLQKIVDEQQKAADRLMELQRKLRALNRLLPPQLDVLNQMDATYNELIRATKSAKTLIEQANEKNAGRPPNAAPRSGFF